MLTQISSMAAGLRQRFWQLNLKNLVALLSMYLGGNCYFARVFWRLKKKMLFVVCIILVCWCQGCSSGISVSSEGVNCLMDLEDFYIAYRRRKPLRCDRLRKDKRRSRDDSRQARRLVALYHLRP